MAMQLTILGSSASMPGPNDACSGYLVSHNDTHILLDCGTGVISALQSAIPLENLSTVVISHFHPDHFIDLIPLRYGLRYGPTVAKGPCVLLPPGGREHLATVGAGLRNSETYFSSTYEMEEYDPTADHVIEGLSISFCRTTHDIPTWAMRVTDDTRTLVYTADTQGSPELEVFATGADTLLCESTYPSTLENLPSGNHLTSKQAGELATAAGAGQLILTHFWPGIERSLFLNDAAETFGGDIQIAEQGRSFAI